MTITEITQLANSYTDENFTPQTVLKYANSAISRINIVLKSLLPQFSASLESVYLHLSDDWLLMTVVPYVCWSIKMNDSSINEAREYLIQFETNLRELKKNKKTAIPEEWQSTSFKSVYPITRYTGMPKTSTTVKVVSTDPLGLDEEE